MKNLARLGARLFNVPLFLDESKADILAGIYQAKLRGEPMASLDDDGHDDEAPSDQSGIRIIPIHGTLVHRTVGMQAASGFTSYKAIGAQLKAALADASVSSIMLDVDSNGGEVAGCIDLAGAIFAARKEKPIYAFVDERCFSACYLLASGAHRIYVPRTGGVGSVGTLMMLRDQSAADEMAGVKYTAIYAGARKVDGNPHAALTDEARKRFQHQVDSANDILVETVGKHRSGKITAEQVRALQAGTFFGPEGVEKKLADVVATYDEALADLSKVAASGPKAKSDPLRQRFYALGPVPEVTAAIERGDTELPPLGTSAELHPGNAERETMSEANKPKDEESKGTKPADTAKPAEATATVVDLDAARKEGEAQALAYVREVTDLCAMVGKPEMAADFIAKKVKPEDVRANLLAAKASQTDANTVSGHNQPGTGAQAGDHGWSKIVAGLGAGRTGYSPAGLPSAAAR